MTAGLRSRPDRADTADGITIWSRDAVAVVMPTPRPDWPPTILNVYMARVESNLSGRCPFCLAVAHVQPTAPRQASGSIAHDDDCAVADAAFLRWFR